MAKIRKNYTGIIHVPLTEEDNELAFEHGVEVGQLNNSITEGVGNLAGTLGELAFLKIYQDAYRDKEVTFDYDFLLYGKKWEIKTKNRTVPASLSFAASISDCNPEQEADYYGFVSVIFNKKLDRFTGAEMIGYITPEDYFEQAVFCKKGETDPNSAIGWTFKGDCYNVLYRDMNRFGMSSPFI